MKQPMKTVRVAKRCKWAAIGWLMMSVFACASQGQTADPNKSGEPKSEPLYIIQPDDILEIFVWKEPDLTRKVRVRPDGRISFPLVQDLQAAGLNPGELKSQVEKKLSDFLTAPEVTIIVDNILGYKIYVLGKVQKPGNFTVETPVTVLQALTLAGGFQDYAKKTEITITRTIGKDNTVFKFNYDDVIKGKRTEQNMILKPGDVVVVP
jgi:polysaccharide biosynthesis/export protein